LSSSRLQPIKKLQLPSSRLQPIKKIPNQSIQHIPPIPSIQPIPISPSILQQTQQIHNQVQNIRIQTLPPTLPLPDVHDYTIFIQKNFKNYLPLLTSVTINDDEFFSIINELFNKYGPKNTYNNLKINYHHGQINDPEIPGLNSAILLKIIWETLKNINDPSMFKHFNETLDQIGMTCIQGISHRLFNDFISFCAE
jgi:hypothetical protein